MNTILRIGLAAGLLAVAGFCVYGFLACFEPPVLTEMMTLYAVTGVCSVAGVFATAFCGQRRATLIRY
jgi:hypothetical protein